MCDENRVHVGNLDFHTTEDNLWEAFEQYGTVTDCKLIIDRETQRSRGFAFITFQNNESAKEAIGAGGFDLGGRQIRVSIAQARSGGGGGGGFQGGRGGGGGGGGGYGGGQRSYGGGQRSYGGGDGYGRQGGGGGGGW